MEQFQISENLLRMNGVHGIGRLDLDRQTIIDQQIDTRDLSKVDAIENDIDRPLPINFISHGSQTPGKKCLINAFQQPRTDLAMQTHRNPDHVMRNIIDMPSHVSAISAPLREAFKGF
jgi:hypothetical protein